jgi:tetratricopeptide (TPR) repeat protein
VSEAEKLDIQNSTAPITDVNHELGRLYCERAEFEKAIPHLEKAAETYFNKKDYSNYLKILNLLLRIYSEREQFDLINATKEKLQDLVLKEGFELNSRTYYTLALCAQYKSQTEIALDYFQKALAIALAADHKEDICYAIYGLAYVYSNPGIAKFQEALKEIYNLQVFFQVYDFPDLKISTQILNADILRQLKRYEDAIEVLWKSFEDVRKIRNIMTTNFILALLGSLHFEMGDKDTARMYLQLAQKSVDAKNQVRLARMIKAYIDKIGGPIEQNYDLVFDEENHAVVERKIGKIDFKNQFILLDLLKLFIQNQGSVFSKEYLVENVWKQPYDPAVHDNKIYVTIKRLRKLIEPDFDKPKYIFRAKNGYYMNKSAKIHVEH